MPASLAGNHLLADVRLKIEPLSRPTCHRQFPLLNFMVLVCASKAVPCWGITRSSDLKPEGEGCAECNRK